MATMSEEPNVVLLTLDAFRADHLSSFGYEKPTTPNIDRFLSEAACFSRAFSVSSHTREAMPGLLTGEYPNDVLDDGYKLHAETVAGTLNRNGFTTAGFHSNPYLSRAYGFERGFDTFDDDLYFGRSKAVALFQRALDKLRNRHYAPADEINSRSLGWLDSLDDGPFFLWNHYMDAHGPYQPPESVYNELHGGSLPDRDLQQLYRRSIQGSDTITDQERELLVDLYDAEIRDLDGAIGEFVDALERRNLFEDTVIILTADHGDAFGEERYFSHPRHLHDELLHVPFAVAGPTVPAGRYDGVVTTLDVVPTILDETGVNGAAGPGTPAGSILNDDTNSRRTVFAQARDLDADVFRFAARRSDGEAFLEWNLSAEAVAEGSKRDTTLEGDLVDELESHCRDRMTSTSVTEADDEVSDEVARRLETLGYKE